MRAKELDIAEVESRTRLLLSLRWVALAGQAMSLWPGRRLGWLASSSLQPYILILLGFALITASFQIALRRKALRASEGFLFFQLSLDVMALTFLLAWSGGPWNPFASLLFFHGALGALLLNSVHVVLFLAVLACALAFLHLFPAIPPALAISPTPSEILLPVHLLMLLSLVGLLAWVSRMLARGRRELMILRDEKHRLDHLRAFGILATGFSHEFATPLMTLEVRLQRLQRRATQKQDLDDLCSATAAVWHCNDALKRLVTRQMEPESTQFVRIELTEFLPRLLKQWKESLSAEIQKGINLEVAIPEGLFAIRAPMLSLTQCVLDLLDNAMRAALSTQHLATGSACLGVKLSEKRLQDGLCESAQPVHPGLNWAVLEIFDNGPGFPMHVRQQLGEPFLTTRRQSSGLGLYHAVTLAHALNGTLEIGDNPNGRGACVTLTLPIYLGVKK